VTLAYPFDGHEPDETVDLPDAEARRLLNDGRARPAKRGAQVASATQTTPKKRGSGRQTRKEK
jgi:hypothetical protein